MKKRAKIITTVASLCLAVALMAFGVYAANQVTFSISSQVSFTVTDIFVTIDASAQLASDDAQTMTQYKSYVTEDNGTKHAKAGEYDTAVTPSWGCYRHCIHINKKSCYICYNNIKRLRSRRS